jgi:hypothetical protein
VIANGPQTPYLEATTELFDGPMLDPVRAANNPFLVFQDCLGGLHDPLKFFARAASGTQLVVPGAFSYPAVARQMQQAWPTALADPCMRRYALARQIRDTCYVDTRAV